MGLAPEVLRYMRQGEDPGRIVQVNPEIISSVITQVNAYEAAIWSRRVELVQLLDRERPIDPAERQRLACLAADLEAQDILTYLSGGESAPCEPKATSSAIEARSRD
jgi:hypothetical protein